MKQSVRIGLGRVLTISLAVVLTIVFHGTDRARAIGQPADVYDARYGRPAEVTESRGYSTAEWAVFVQLRNGRTRAVTYTRLGSDNRGELAARSLTDDDVGEILRHHDPDQRGWRAARSANQARVWTRNDEEVVAFTRDGVVLNVCDAHDPPFSVPEIGSDDAPGGGAQQEAAPPSTRTMNDEKGLEALARRTIEVQTDIALASLSFREVREMTSSDGTAVVLVVFDHAQGERRESVGLASEAETVNVVIVEFDPSAGLHVERGIVRRGRRHVQRPD